MTHGSLSECDFQTQLSVNSKSKKAIKPSDLLHEEEPQTKLNLPADPCVFCFVPQIHCCLVSCSYIWLRVELIFIKRWLKISNLRILLLEKYI